MSLSRRLPAAVLLAATTAALALPGAAGATAGDLTFPQTYPVASKVCTDIAAGKPKRLKPFATQVLADCATLQTTFTTAQTTVLAQRATIGTALKADRAALALSCPKPSANGAACHLARHTEGPAILALQRERVHVLHVYNETIEASRTTFWAAIKALPGLANVKADAPLTPKTK